MAGFALHTVAEKDLPDLLPLVRAYADFYRASPADEGLLELSRTLIADPDREGVQLIARLCPEGADNAGTAIGFATVFWTWSTIEAMRIGVMNDLFVAFDARGGGVADALIRECVKRCRDHGAGSLRWQTAKDNHRAQTVYERVGGRREEWLDYSLEVPAG